MNDKYVPKDGDISVFPNDKGDNPARPDYTGKVYIAGQMYRVALWHKEAASGVKYMNGKATLPNDQYEGGASDMVPDF